VTVYTNTAEGGTSGTGVTTGNSGGTSGTPWSTVTLGTGSTCTFDNAQAAHGTLSYNFTPGAAAGDTLTLGTASSTTGVMRFYAYFTALPTAATQLARFATSGSLVVANIVIDTAGHVIVQGSAGTLHTSSVTVSLNTWYRFEMSAIVATATTGTVNMAAYVGDSMTVFDSYSPGATVNLGTTNFAKVNFGKVSSSGNWATFYMDDFAVDDTQTTFFGPSGSRAGTVTVRGTPSVDGANSTSTVTSRTPAITAGTAVGELMVASCSWSGSTVTLTPPTGWTLLHNAQQTNENLATYYRYYQAADPDPVFTLSATCTAIALCATFSGSAASSGLADANQLGGAASTTVTYPSIGPINANDLLVYVAGFRPAAASTQSTLSTLPTGGPGGSVTKVLDSCTNVAGVAEVQIALLTQQLSSTVGAASQTSTDSQSGSAVVEAFTIPASLTASGSTASGSLSLSGSAVGGSAATGALSLSGSAVGGSVAAGSITLGGSAVASFTASAAVTLTATAVGSETATGSLSLSATATGKAPATAAGTVTLSGQAVPPGGTAATATAAVSLNGTAAGTAKPTAAGSLALSGSVSAKALAGAAAQVSLAALANAVAPATALASITLSGTLLSVPPVTPPERMYIIVGPLRTLVIPADSRRAFLIPADTRTLLIPADSRTVSVMANNRTAVNVGGSP
jgi:hypothetical protein